MRPTLEPGDRVLAVRLGRPRPRDLVAVRDPRDTARTIVKRVDMARHDGVVVVGDNPDESTDSRHFGVVPNDLVRGRVVYRYAPPSRAGRVTQE